MSWIFRSLLKYISYGEFKRLIVCVCLDVVEYGFLFSLPFAGEIFGIAALVACLVMFGWIGLIAALDILPDADIFPINTITWLVWILIRHWGDILDAMVKHLPYTNES